MNVVHIQFLRFKCLAVPPVAHACPNIKLLLSSAIILCLFSCLDYYHSSSTTKGTTTLHLSRGSNSATALTNLVQIPQLILYTTSNFVFETL